MDANRDLHLSPVHKRDVTKLAAMADSFLWNNKTDIISCISDGRLLTWYYPNAIYVDKDLMDICKNSREASEIGRMSQMICFAGSSVILRRKDGGLITLPISPYPVKFYHSMGDLIIFLLINNSF
jgi:intraflagellar transport protein 80